MQTTKFVTKKVEVIDDIFCNKCGESCKADKEHEFGFLGLIEAEVSGGYFSETLVDGEYYKFSLCEKCLKELFETFKHDPLVHMVW